MLTKIQIIGIIIGIVLVLAIGAVLLWYFLVKKKSSPPSPSSTSGYYCDSNTNSCTSCPASMSNCPFRQSDCDQQCSKPSPSKKYKCDSTNGCITDPNGTLSDCSSCPKPKPGNGYSCQAGVCVSGSSGTQSLPDCEKSCKTVGSNCFTGKWNPTSSPVKIYGTTKEDNPDAVNGQYEYGNPNSQLCLAMKWDNDNTFICGTFDGLGIWTWEATVEFLVEFSSWTGLQELALYDTQFFMPHWMSAPTVTEDKLLVTAKDGVQSVPIYDGDPSAGKTSWTLRIHLYHGAWPNLNDYTDGDEAGVAPKLCQGMWTDFVKFVKAQPIVKYFYMNIDQSGFTYKNGNIESTAVLTPDNIAKWVDQMVTAAPNVEVGVVITADPKYGFIIPITQPPGGPVQYAPEQKGGSTDTNWQDPPARSAVPKLDPSNSVCINQDYDGGSIYPGCPNVIQNSMYLISEANKLIKTTKITRILQDSENNGTAGSKYCSWWASMLQYLKASDSSFDPTKARLGSAGAGSMNTDALMDFISNCSSSVQPPIKKSNLIALPEMYWYVDLIKNGLGHAYDETSQNVQTMKAMLKTAGMCDNGSIEEFLQFGSNCNGCDKLHTGPGRQANMDQMQQAITQYPGKGWPDSVHVLPAKDDAITCTDPNTPSSCTNYLTPAGNMASESGDGYAQCVKDCGGPCCLWSGCAACIYDAENKTNTKNPYIIFLNDGKNLAKFLVLAAKELGYFDGWTQNPGTIPMFSNEVGHDFKMDPNATGLSALQIGI